MSQRVTPRHLPPQMRIHWHLMMSPRRLPMRVRLSKMPLLKMPRLQLGSTTLALLLPERPALSTRRPWPH
jgi:hypothetical protein